MNKRPFVSITVPVYKAEKTLRLCIDSLINQTLKNIEIILVDDGSPDSSGSICDEYALKDDRIKVFHQKNGGSAAARQCGLEYSTGEYYTVCDSDDWVELTMYEVLYKTAVTSNADIVDSRFYSNYPNGKQLQSASYIYKTQEQYIEDLMTRQISIMTPSKLIKLDLIRNENVNYEFGVNLGEDALFIFKLLQNPIKIVVVDNAFYHYRRDMNSQSITTKISMRVVKNEEYIHKWKLKSYPQKRYVRGHLCSLINLAFVALRSPDVDACYYKNVVQQLYVRDLIKYKVINLKSLFILSTKLFGLSFGRMLFNRLYHIFYK